MMRIMEIKLILKNNRIFYLTGLTAVLILKLFYRSADSCGFMWILAPTARWVGLLGGYSFENIPHVGYVNHDMQFIIAKSCSGVQFMIITLAALIFSYTHHVTRNADSPVNTMGAMERKKGFLWLALCLFLSYLSTILVNGLRIILSIELPPILERRNIYEGTLTPERLHTLIGCAVYFSSLLIIYRFAGRLSLIISGSRSLSGTFSGRLSTVPVIADSQINRRADIRHFMAKPLRRLIPPTFWYLFMVLGIPLLHHEKNGCGQLAEFAALVTVICLVVFSVFYLVSLRKD